MLTIASTNNRFANSANVHSSCAHSKMIHGTSPLETLKESFRSEAELVDSLQSVLFRGLKPRIRLVKEFNSANGIADLVMVQLRKNWKESLSIGHIPPRWAYALHHLPYRRLFSAKSLADEWCVSEEKAVSCLKLYSDLGYCEKGKVKDMWRKTHQPLPIINNLCAIEAKLKDWKRALSQAIRYLDYAHQSWVILDERHSNAAIDNLERFSNMNIGFATIRPGGLIKIQFSPVPLKPKSPNRFWYANAELASKLIL